MTSPCCSPSRQPGSPTTSRPSPTGGSVASERVTIPAGPFEMGTQDDRFPADREGPVRSVDVAEFMIATTLVTNAAWAAFVEETDGVFAFTVRYMSDIRPNVGVHRLRYM